MAGLLIGLTGGIGSGKSAVSASLRRRGVPVLDADAIVHELQRPGARGLRRLVEEFGPTILQPSGELDRRALARLVFADAGARKQVEAILHPLVRERMSAEAEAAFKRGAPAVVEDIPLLFESRDASGFDATVLVYAPPEVQRQRLVELRGMTPADAEARIAAQLPMAEKRGRATYVIDNTGSLEDLEAEVDRVWAQVTGRDC